MTNKPLVKLDSLQLERVTAGMMEHVENDTIARFALETHLHEINEKQGSHAVARFATSFFNSLGA